MHSFLMLIESIVYDIAQIIRVNPAVKTKAWVKTTNRLKEKLPLFEI